MKRGVKIALVGAALFGFGLLGARDQAARDRRYQASSLSNYRHDLAQYRAFERAKAANVRANRRHLKVWINYAR